VEDATGSLVDEAIMAPIGLSLCARGAGAVLLVLSAAACQESRHNVDVRLDVPASLDPAYLRVSKFIQGELEKSVLTRVSAPVSGGPVSAKYLVGVPRDGRTVVVRAEAIRDDRLLADGVVQLDLTINQAEVPMRACIRTPPVLDTATLEPCAESPAGNGFAGPGPEAGTGDAGDGGVGDALPSDVADGTNTVTPPVDGSSTPAWTPPMCQMAPPEIEAQRAVPRPAVVSAACEQYCAAMEANCTLIGPAYSTRNHCLQTCETLAWPATGGATDEDSLACRLAYAESASGATSEQERALRCVFAMPRTQEACGDTCGVYCRMGTLICPAEFPSAFECKNACLAKQRALEAQGNAPDIYDQLHCRLKFLELAVFDRRFCSAGGLNRCDPCSSFTIQGP
jgi:hypothetical protein